MVVERKNRHCDWDGIRAWHWIETGRRCGIVDMEAIIADIGALAPAAIDRGQATVPRGFPTHIADTVLAGVRASSARLRTGWPEISKT